MHHGSLFHLLQMDPESDLIMEPVSPGSVNKKVDLPSRFRAMIIQVRAA
jgi:hypothetical protein